MMTLDSELVWHFIEQFRAYSTAAMAATEL
jgi:hypothetical protein